jgi:hypothetical protein
MAWTISVSYHKDVRIKHVLGGDTMVVLKVACVSDALGGSLAMKHRSIDPGNSYVEYMDRIRGSWLYLMKTVPGTGGDQPTAAFDLDVEDENTDHILDTDSNANDANTFTVGSDTLGVYPPIFDYVGLEIGTLGDENTADIYLYFLK